MLNVAIINFRFNHFKHPKEQLKVLLNEKMFFDTVLINIFLDMTGRTILNKLLCQDSDFVRLIKYCKDLGLKVMISSKFSTLMNTNQRIFTKHVESKINEFINLGIETFFCDFSGDINYKKNYNDLIKFVQNKKITLYDFQPIKDNHQNIFGLFINSLNRMNSEQIFCIPVDKLTIRLSSLNLNNSPQIILYKLQTTYYGIPKDYIIINNTTNLTISVKKKNLQEYYACFPDEISVLKYSTNVVELS